MSNFETLDKLRFHNRLKLQGCATGRFDSYTPKRDIQSEQIEAQRKAKQIMRANESHYTN